jgi:hypothetical protein
MQIVTQRFGFEPEHVVATAREQISRHVSKKGVRRRNSRGPGDTIPNQSACKGGAERSDCRPRSPQPAVFPIPESRSYGEGMHEAIKDIEKAMKGLASYLF